MSEALEEMERLSAEAASLSKTVETLRPADARVGKKKKKRRPGTGSKLTSSATSVASSVANSPLFRNRPVVSASVNGSPKGLDFRN